MENFTISTLRAELLFIGMQSIFVVLVWLHLADPSGLQDVSTEIFTTAEGQGWLAVPVTVALIGLAYSFGAAADGLGSLFKALVEGFWDVLAELFPKIARPDNKAKAKFKREHPDLARHPFSNDFEQRLLRACGLHVWILSVVFLLQDQLIAGKIAFWVGLIILVAWFRRLWRSTSRMKEAIAEAQNSNDANA